MYYLRSRYYNPTLQRFLLPDTLLTSRILSTNLFSYCENAPCSNADPTGKAIDTVLDLLGCAYSAYELIQDCTWGNAGNLLIDVGCLLVPFVPSTSLARGAAKAVKYTDDLQDARKTVVNAQRTLSFAENAPEYNKALDAIKDTAKTLPTGNNTVYLSVLSDANLPEYVGITKNFAQRSRYWNRRNRFPSVWITGLDRTSARFVEQATIDLIGRWPSANTGPLANIINSIGPNSPISDDYRQFLNEVMERMQQ